jgi:TatD DNase family protein
MLVDTHAHLDDARFASEVEAVIARARAAGVLRIVTVGAGVASSAAALDLARRFPETLRATVGIHPHDADGATDSARREIESLASAREVVAVGETGLDYHYDNSSRAGQRSAFEWQVDLAARSGKPVVVHCREAFDDCMAVLQSRGRGVALRGVAHCFSGDWTQARAFLDLGLCLSFAGPLTFPKATALRDVAARAPLDRIVVETDCPYLAPQPVRGRRNEPAFLTHTVAALEALRPADAGFVREALARNVTALFGSD